MTRREPTYWEYLRIEDLLSLQGGLEGDEGRLSADELHFIVVHQVFELWFKLCLRELALARDWLSAPRVPEHHVPRAVHHLRRVNEIFRVLVEQFRVMETLTPQDFLEFRGKITPASGFQSAQMRELEILAGLPDRARAHLGELPFDAALRDPRTGQTSPALARVEARRRDTPSLREALERWLYRAPIHGSSPRDDDDRPDPGDAGVVEGFLASYLRSHAAASDAACERLLTMSGAGGQDPERARDIRARFAVQREAAEAFIEARDVADAGDRPRARRVRAALLFIESYRELPLLAWPRLLIDTVVEFEEGFILWRNRHARMVERVIGRRVGTGGSSGVDYLDATTRYRIFADLWTVRALLLPRDVLPGVENEAYYGFRYSQ